MGLPVTGATQHPSDKTLFLRTVDMWLVEARDRMLVFICYMHSPCKKPAVALLPLDTTLGLAVYTDTRGCALLELQPTVRFIGERRGARGGGTR